MKTINNHNDGRGNFIFFKMEHTNAVDHSDARESSYEIKDSNNARNTGVRYEEIHSATPFGHLKYNYKVMEDTHIKKCFF